jgi:hypothetical protein
MLKNLRNILLAGIILTTFSVESSAATMKAVFEGTVTSGNDNTNLFGQGVGSVLAGLSFVMTVIYDPAAPGGIRATMPPVADEIRNNPGNGLPPAIASAVFTIGGHSEIFGSGSQARVKTFSNGAVGLFETSVSSYANGSIFPTSSVSVFFGPVAGVPNILDTAFAATTSFSIASYFSFGIIPGQLSSQASGYMEANRVTVTLLDGPSQVPVPAALPLFAASIGALGVAARRRRKQKAAV